MGGGITTGVPTKNPYEILLEKIIELKDKHPNDMELGKKVRELLNSK